MSKKNDTKPAPAAQTAPAPATESLIEVEPPVLEMRIKTFKLKLGGFFLMPGSRDEYTMYDVRQRHFEGYHFEYRQGEGVWVYAQEKTDELVLIPLDHISCIVFEPAPTNEEGAAPSPQAI